MHVIAITRLATPIEIEAVALAADLGTHAYDERLKLAAGLPTVVLLELVHAKALHDRLVARGHGVLLCAASDLVPSAAMISLRRFRYDEQGLYADDEDLPWADVSALVRATDRRRRDTVSTVTEKSFDLSRTLATGGLITSKTTRRDISTSVNDSEQLLFVFRRSGETPWLLREQGTHFGGLGTLLAHSTTTNFAITTEQLRARAPAARYDDRLINRRGTQLNAKPGSWSPNDLELLAHVVATAA